MKRELLNSVCPLLREYLTYSETIKGKSTQTVEQYCIDITLFFKYLKQERALVKTNVPFEDIEKIGKMYSAVFKEDKLP